MPHHAPPYEDDPSPWDDLARELGLEADGPEPPAREPSHAGGEVPAEVEVQVQVEPFDATPAADAVPAEPDDRPGEPEFGAGLADPVAEELPIAEEVEDEAAEVAFAPEAPAASEPEADAAEPEAAEPEAAEPEADETEADAAVLAYSHPPRGPLPSPDDPDPFLGHPLFRERADGRVELSLPRHPLPWPADDFVDGPEESFMAEPDAEPAEAEADAEVDIDGVAPEGEEGDAKPGKARRRRRRRKRGPGKADDAAPAAAEAPEPAAVRAPAVPEDDDADEDDDDEEFELVEAAAAPVEAWADGNGDHRSPLDEFKDWDMPTWRELIASLYKPS